MRYRHTHLFVTRIDLGAVATRHWMSSLEKLFNRAFTFKNGAGEVIATNNLFEFTKILEAIDQRQKLLRRVAKYQVGSPEHAAVHGQLKRLPVYTAERDPFDYHSVRKFLPPTNFANLIETLDRADRNPLAAIGGSAALLHKVRDSSNRTCHATLNPETQQIPVDRSLDEAEIGAMERMMSRLGWRVQLIKWDENDLYE